MVCSAREAANERRHLMYRQRRSLVELLTAIGLIAGEIISITSMFNPGYAYVMLFAAMTLVLVLRPHGLFGSQSRA